MIQLEKHRATRFQNGVRTHQTHSIFFHEASHRDQLCLSPSLCRRARFLVSLVNLAFSYKVFGCVVVEWARAQGHRPREEGRGVDLTRQHSTTDKHFEHHQQHPFCSGWPTPSSRPPCPPCRATSPWTFSPLLSTSGLTLNLIFWLMIRDATSGSEAWPRLGS